uniref:7TM_GPCR_Srx domain-containing protein n=1 Tax=Caenorhabditis tropicalis TaxID=1561998 RepID=A0A1I7V3B7_9PELO
MLCASKSLTNLLASLAYFFYIGPANLLYTRIGPLSLDIVVHNLFMYGVMIQGPTTQLMTTVNRILVVWLSPTNPSPLASRLMTVTILLLWIFFFWTSTLLGLSDSCNVPFAFGHTDWFWSPCSDRLLWIMIYIIFVMAAATSILNLGITVKLIWLSHSQSMSSNALRARRKKYIRFFLQTCIQDWILAVDVVNNIGTTKYCSSQTCIMLISQGVDVIVYTVDGFVLYWFNCRTRKVGVVKQPKRPSEGSTVLV